MLIKYTVPSDLASQALPVQGSGSRSVSGGAYSVGITFVSGRLQPCRVQYTDKKGSHEKDAYLCLEDYRAEVTLGSGSRFIEASQGDVLFPYSPWPILSWEIV